MIRNITLELDDAVLKRASDAAAQHKQPLSQWLSRLLTDAISESSTSQEANRAILNALDQTFDLGGKPLTRDEIYAERLR
jgi:hypothetical protein